MFLQYFNWGLRYFVQGIGIALFLYAVILIFLWKKGIREKVNSQEACLEFVALLYVLMILKILGILGMNIHFMDLFTGNIHAAWVPFVGRNAVVIIMNFILFFPFGALLPKVFYSQQWRWKKALKVAAVTALALEVLHVLGGQYARLDDFLAHTLGTIAGYLLLRAFQEIRTKEQRKQGIVQLVRMFLITMVSLVSISVICKCTQLEEVTQGMENIEAEDIQEMTVSYNEQEVKVSEVERIYSQLSVDLKNMAGYFGVTKKITKTKAEILQGDTHYIEVKYNNEQTMMFEDNADVTFENTVCILVDLDHYEMYWGSHEGSYTYKVDLIVLEEENEEKYEKLTETFSTLYTEIEEILTNEK